MKAKLLLFFFCLSVLSGMGQRTTKQNKCKTCGKVISQCRYKGKHPKPTPKPKTTPRGTASYQNEVLRVGNVSYRMKYVSGGTFTMGGTSEMEEDLYWMEDDYYLMDLMDEYLLREDEKPTHQVTLSSYYIGETEVTQALWKAVMGSNPSYFKGDNLPVENVSWNDCQTFISKLNALTGKNFRLPTEAEWEFAARGGNQSRHTQYSGSSHLDDVAWYRYNSGKKTHPVKTKQPNEPGIYDMTGNVWEWCQDWYGDYSSYAQTNPTGAGSGFYRVIRGGSWIESPEGCRSSYRGSSAPGNSHNGLGFRLVLSQTEEAGYDVTFTCNVSSAALSIDGTSYGAVSGTRFLKTGTHTIRLTANGYENYTSTITVNRQNRSFHFTMTEKEELVSYQNEVLRVGNVSYRMKYVSGGTFTMGATKEMKDPSDNEKPKHQVTLSSYYIGETEVTQALWKAVMGSNPSHFKGDDLPVECVSWNDCRIFISKLNALTGKRFRLPTEAEWEFAARGGNQSRHTQYSGSSRIDDVAWYEGNSGSKTHPVKTKQPNELGIYDMTGNVWEWCQDCCVCYSRYAQTNPISAGSGSHRVYRGGSWYYSSWSCRSSHRDGGTPEFSSHYVGLRLVLSQ